MRTYLILKEKVQRFAADGEIQGLLAELRQQDSAYDGPGAADGYTGDRAQELKSRFFDPAAIAARGRRMEELDQLVMELLLGVR
jgi:xylose isomerase